MEEEVIDGQDVSDSYFIEEIDSKNIPEAELAEFQEAQPLEVMGFVNDDNITEEEPELIKRYVRGELEFPELYTKLEPEDDEEEDEEAEDNEQVNDTNTQEDRSIEIDDDYDDEQPTTSAQAAKQLKSYKYINRNDEKLEMDRLSSDRPKCTRKRTVLSGALQGLMGEANLSYARGKIEMAEKLCLEIIRQNPLASEPFLTLAEIYETRDKEKHLNFLTIAAHLNPHDRDQWIRIAEMHIAKGNLIRARAFYSKAIKALRKDYDLRLRKARLLEQMNDQPSAMATYLHMIPFVPVEESELCLEIAKKVATYYHQCKKPHLALEAMDGAHKLFSELFSMEDLNLYLELLILNKEYRKVVHCLYERTRFDLKIEYDENQGERIVYVRIPDDYLPDFRAKLCVSLIKLRPYHLLFYLVQNVHSFIPPVEEHLNLYVDIAEALMQEHKYAEAIELLRPITNCEQLESCPAFIWLRQAECLRQLNKYNDAIDSYQQVVANAPYCYEAKFTLAALLKQQGRYDEAVIALEQAEESEGQPLHARLLYERCMMLKQVGDIDGYLEAGCNFLARRSLKLRTREEISTIASGVGLYHLDGLKTILQMRNIVKSDMPPDSYEFNIRAQTDITDMTIEDEYKLFLELIRIGFENGKYSMLERICFAMITTKRFIDFHDELEYIIILACYFNNDCSVAFSYLREPILRDLTKNSLWNLLNLFFQKAQDVRYCRFIRRIIQRCPNLKHLRIFLAHYSLNCSSYKLALNVYSQLFKENPTSLLALCIAVAFNQVSMQKRVLSRTAAVGQAVAFIEKYANMRRLECSDIGNEGKSTEESCCVAEQEICYNIGRIYHQAGISHLAIEYYERALRVQHPFIKAHENILGLQHEIAYNLHLIYRASGNLRKARHYLYNYCVV